MSLLSAGVWYATTASSAHVGTARVLDGAPLYSENEIRSLELRTVTLSDLEQAPAPTIRLARGTHVRIDSDTRGWRALQLQGIGGAPSPIYFQRASVVDGPARNEQGWIQVGAVDLGD